MTELSPILRNVLNVVTEKTNRNVSWSVTDTVIIQAFEDNKMRADEAYRYPLQLEGLNLIKIGIKVSGSDFRMINITKEGLEESSKNQAQA
jgi:hypothetical protein